MNPNTMTAQQIAEQATPVRIADAIARATQLLMQDPTNVARRALVAKLTEALRIARSPRTSAAPVRTPQPRHANRWSPCEFAGIGTDGLAVYVGYVL